MSEAPELPPEASSPVRPDPKLIQELFDADPLGLSDQDIDRMIEFYRADRQAYLQAPAEKAKRSPKVAGPKAPKVTSGSQIDIEDLLK